MTKSKGFFMKNFKRIISLLLSLIISATLLISCDWVLFIPVNTTSKGLPEYTLTENYVEETKNLLKQAENTTLNNKTTIEINFAWSQFIDRYYEIATQANVSFILFASDSENEEYKQAYLFANNSYSELYGLYTDSLKRIYNSPSSETFFYGWTKEEIDAILNHDEEVVALEQENSELEVEYASLDDDEFTDGAVEIYKQIIKNNNKIASKFGFENYYEYASKTVYERDYSKTELAFFRDSVANMIVPLADKVISGLSEQKELLTSNELSIVSQLVYNDYDKTKVNYWKNYLNSYQDSSLKSKLSHAFDNQNVTFANGANSREMAFTANLPSKNKSYCYFGPGYQDVFTVAHEIGHYSAGLTLGIESVSMDLKETHSQANEMLLLDYLSTEISPNAYEVLKSSIIGEALASIVICSIIDEFEYRVFTQKSVDEFTSEDFDGLMSEVCEKYGGVDYVNEKFTDINLYWRKVVVEQPIYYISYATSGFSAINLYVSACANRQEARESYDRLISLSDTSLGFVGSLKSAGLVNPFTAEAFKTFQDYVLGSGELTPVEPLA